MNSIFNQFEEEVRSISKNNKSLGSDAIAEIIAKQYIDIKAGSLGRHIRKAGWLKEEAEKDRLKQAKILIFDIETAPAVAAVWGIWGQNINTKQIMRDWFILSWSAKWLFEDEVMNMSLNHSELKRGDDKRIVEGMWNILDEADIVIAHNLKKFDKKVAQSAFLKHRLNPTSHYKEIDTLVTFRQQFREMSNRLDDVARITLGIEGKLATSAGLWMDVIGNPLKGIEPSMDAMENMVLYCDQDVRLLEDVYLILRPWITNHPNVNLFLGTEVNACKACGSEELEPIGDYTTIVNTYDGFRCKNCGSVHRSRKPSTKKEVKDNLLR